MVFVSAFLNGKCINEMVLRHGFAKVNRRREVSEISVYISKFE